MSWSGSVGEEALVAVPVEVGEAQLRARVRDLLAHDQPRPFRPAAEVELPGQLGDPGPLALLLPVGVERRTPAPLRQRQRRLPDPLVDVVAKRVTGSCARAAPRRRRGWRRPSRAREQRHRLLAVAVGDLGRQLRQRLLQHGDVVGGGVRAGVAGPQHAGEMLAGLVEEAVQRMEAEAALAVRPATLLLGVALQQLRVEVERDRLRARPQLPRPALARRGEPPRIAARSFSPSACSSRLAVDCDATWPNKSGCSASAPRSETQSPPSTSIVARSTTTRPGIVHRPTAKQMAQPARKLPLQPQPRRQLPQQRRARARAQARPDQQRSEAIRAGCHASPSRCVLLVRDRGRDNRIIPAQEDVSFPHPQPREESRLDSDESAPRATGSTPVMLSTAARYGRTGTGPTVQVDGYSGEASPQSVTRRKHSNGRSNISAGRRASAAR